MSLGPITEERLRSNSYRIWNDPTPAEKAAIVNGAFNLADPDESVLFWGVGSIKRPL